MAYTDKELRAFTQVAYADFAKSYDFLHAQHPERTSFSIAELKEAALLNNFEGDLSSLNCLTDNQLASWSISAVHDTNATNGFYACVIETSPGDAVITFRGSESMCDLSNLYNDWLCADLGLLNSTCTNQQSEAERFLAKYQDQLEGYNSITLTGHSLGGNLAEYTTIVSGEYGLDDNIAQCVSMDGPGFSNKFIDKYSEQINSMSGVIKHYRWSMVGTLLNDLPGVRYQYVSVENNMDGIGSDFFPITRHDTVNLVYDENGNLIPSRQDVLSMCTSHLSKIIDLKEYIEDELNYSLIGGLFMFGTGAQIGWNGLRNMLSNVFSFAGGLFEGIGNGISGFFSDNGKNEEDVEEDNYLLVDTIRLSTDIQRLRELLNMIKNNVDEMYSKVQVLNGMWTGTASNTFINNFSEDYEDAKSYLAGFENCIVCIENQCTGYKNSDERAMSLVESLSN